MKLVYIANTGIPSDWAHSVQIMKMCEAFAENGAEVELVVAGGRNGNDKSNPFSFYNVKPIFKIVRVPSLNFSSGSPAAVWYWIRLISFLISARIYLLTQNYDVVYTRELYATPFFRNVFLERHSFPKVVTKFHKFIFRKVAGLVVLTSFIKSKLVEIGISSEKILTASDAVRLEDFSNSLSKEESRKRFNLPVNSHIICYAGTLKTMAKEKGVTTAIDAMELLNKNYILYVVGGDPEDVEFYKSYANTKKLNDRIIFVGKIPHKEIPEHLAVADVLIAPFPDIEHYKFYMSPLKIFEYMASKRPIVASDLPSIREILHEGYNARLFPPGNIERLAQAIEEMGSREHPGNKFAEQAFNDVREKYTWKKRARNIIEFIRPRI